MQSSGENCIHAFTNACTTLCIFLQAMHTGSYLSTETFSPFLWWGKGAQKTLPCFSSVAVLQQRCKLQACNLHASGVSLDRCSRWTFREARWKCTPCKTDWRVIFSNSCNVREGCTAAYMMGQGWQLKAPNLELSILVRRRPSCEERGGCWEV